MTAPTANQSRDWWHPLSIVLVVAIGYGLLPTRLPLVGEETCRALHGVEMAESGDWLVATNQYVPILDRPPLQYWLLAVVQRFVHDLDPFTVRLLMAVVTLATALTVWWYARRLLSPTGALVAGLVYPTMGHVLDLGRRVETDGLFALLLAGSLFAWHHGYERGWRRSSTWIVGGLIASLAALTKGLQAPIAFFGTTWLFLCCRREFRSLFSFAHLAGVVAFLVPIAIWQVPFFLHAGWEGTRMTWLDPGTTRMQREFGYVVAHLAKFPFEVLGALMPWSLLLFGLLDRRFWGLSSRQGSALLFLSLGVATVFLPVWLSDGLPRYVAPCYPLIAVVCGLVVDRAMVCSAGGVLGRLWRYLVRGLAVACVAFLAVAIVATIAAPHVDAPWAERLSQPWWLLAGFGVMVLAGAPMVWRRAGDVAVSAIAIAVLLAALFNGPILQTKINRAEDVQPKIVALRSELPADVELVSFEPIHHKFVYYWGRRIPILPVPTRSEDLPADRRYFALNASFGKTMDLPFRWEPIAEFNMDPRADDPALSVIVARRVDAR